MCLFSFYRNFKTDFETMLYADPLVLLVPDVASSVVAKLLMWSVKGRVDVSYDELEVINGVIEAMGIFVEYSHFEAAIPSTSTTTTAAVPNSNTMLPIPESYAFQNSLKASDDINVKSEDSVPKYHPENSYPQTVVSCGDSISPSDVMMPKLPLPSSLSSTLPPDSNINVFADGVVSAANSGDANRITCKYCFKHYSNINYKQHLVRIHFKRALFHMTGTADMTKCVLCSKSMAKKGSQSAMENAMAEHLGLGHRLLVKVAPKEIVHMGGPSALEEDESAMECRMCCKRYPRASLKKHLAGVHFRKALFQLVGLTDVKHCNICNKTFNVNESGREHFMALHIGVSHKGLAYVLPADMRDEIMALPDYDREKNIHRQRMKRLLDKEKRREMQMEEQGPPVDLNQMLEVVLE